MLNSAFNKLRTAARSNTTVQALIVRGIRLFGLQNIEVKLFNLLQKNTRKPYVTYRDWLEATLQAKITVNLESLSIPLNPPRLFVVAPTPPAKSGIANYSFALIKSLQCKFQIVLVSESMPEEQPLFKWMSPTEFLSKWRPGDKVLYHFGNNPLHHFQEDLLRKVPGVVDLHDVNLRDYQISKHRKIESEEILEQVIHQKTSHVSKLSLTSRADLPDLNSRIISLGSHIIVHNDAARTRILADNPILSEEDVSVILLAREDKVRPTRQFARTRLGYAESDLVISTFGFVGNSKQTVEILRALKQLTSLGELKGKSIIFNVVGQLGLKSYSRILKAELGRGSGVQIKLTGWVNDEHYSLYLAATDLAVQLRNSENLESSATILDCLFSGLPTIISGIRANEHFPDEFLYRTTGDDLILQLRSVIGNLEQVTLKARQATPQVVGSYGFEASASKYLDALSTQRYPDNISLLERKSRVSKRIFVDVTSVAFFDLGAGIQRVEKRIVGEWLNGMDVTSVEFVPVYFEPSHSKFHTAEKFRADLLGWPGQLFSSAEVVPKPGDTFLGLDLHMSDHIQGELLKWKHAGAAVYFVVYDLLPVVNPSLFPGEMLEGFGKWAKMTSKFDGVFAISQTALKDYLENIEPSGPNFKTGVFSLGADFIPDTVGYSLEKAESGLSGPIEFLMVGTLEPRKGYLEVLEGFTDLWNEGFDGRLTIVGRWGWKVDDLVSAISTSRYNGRLFRIINDASDSDLAALYQGSDCLIAASYNEGFGLPLIEAAHTGLPVFARDTPIFREVGGDSFDYFNSEKSFSHQLASWCENYARGEITPRRKPDILTWKKSAELLLKLVYH